MIAIDTPWDTTPFLRSLKEAGVTTIIRYYNHKSSASLPEKCLTLAEAREVPTFGMDIAVTFQQRQNRVGDFSANAGRSAARRALELAQGEIGQPQGSAIFFSVDFDAFRQSELAAVREYFRAVNRVIEDAGHPYKIGVYGSGKVLDLLRNEGLAERFWISLSRGWSGYDEFIATGAWHIKQVEESRIGRLPVDLNEINSAHADIGAFTIPHGRPLPLGDPHEVIARSGLILRGGPSTDFERLGSAPFGTLVFVLEHGPGDWAKVALEGDGQADGYMYGGFLRALAGG